MYSARYLRKRVYEGWNHRLRTLAGGRWASRCRPTSVALLLTEHCAARCLHCDIWKNTAREENPAGDQWRQVLTDLRRWLGPVQVVFTGGEALMQPSAIPLVEHASRIGLFAEVLTHGFWADQKKIERLALARPWRVTISLDGLDAVHDTVRGRPGFFAKTSATIATLERVRREHSLPFSIRLKFVVMSHNLGAAAEVARFANRPGMDVFYQPVEQNYNTPEDPAWFRRSANWPADTEAALRCVGQLISLKNSGFPIANSLAQLNVMAPYFRDPESLRVAVQSHSAHERNPSCNALTMLEIRANGDVKVCSGLPAVGNIKQAGIREIWENRPRVWESPGRGAEPACCLWRRCGESERAARSLPVLP